MDGLVQVGVTSFGVNCDTITLPNGFTRVSFYSDWIKETICKYSNDRPSDCPEPEGPDPGAVPINVTIRVRTSKQPLVVFYQKVSYSWIQNFHSMITIQQKRHGQSATDRTIQSK
jgi:secreted trypsin-like serine protease